MKKFRTSFNLDLVSEVNYEQRELYKLIEYQIIKHLTNREKRLEFVLRHLIDKPIKGEITKGKLRWRGISLGIHRDYNYGEESYYVVQRGSRIPLCFDEETEKKFRMWCIGKDARDDVKKYREERAKQIKYLEGDRL